MPDLVLDGGISCSNFAIMGLGTSTCSEYLEHVSKNSDIETFYFTYAQGLMSGWNTRGLADKRETLNLALMTLEQQQAHVREFCEKHPDDQYYVAVLHLIKMLRAAGADPLNLRGDTRGSSP